MPLFSITYSFPYLAFLIYLLALMFIEFRFIINDKDITRIRWATIAGYLFFFGLRGLILTDWTVYYPLFDKMPTIWDGGLISAFNMEFTDEFTTDVTQGQAGMEMGFVYFTLLFKSIIPNYFAWMFFNVLIDVLLLNTFIKRYSKYYVLAFIIFFVFEGLSIEINLVRNIKAILLFLVSIKYIEERRIVPFFLLNGLGLLFHTSAIAFFPLYFFLHKTWSKKLIWSFFAGGVLILLLGVTYLAPILSFFGEIIGGRTSLLIELYLKSDLYSGAFGLFHFGYLERVFTFCIMMSFYDKLKAQNEHNVIFLNAYVIYFIIYFYFSEIRVIVERLPLLFVFANWILYPNLFYLIKSRLNKVVFLCIFVLYSFVKITNANQNILAKYDNLLFGIENHEQRLDTLTNNYDKIVDL